MGKCVLVLKKKSLSKCLLKLESLFVLAELPSFSKGKYAKNATVHVGGVAGFPEILLKETIMTKVEVIRTPELFFLIEKYYYFIVI